MVKSILSPSGRLDTITYLTDFSWATGNDVAKSTRHPHWAVASNCSGNYATHYTRHDEKAAYQAGLIKTKSNSIFWVNNIIILMSHPKPHTKELYLSHSMFSRTDFLCR
jgi:hypothetical protein